MMNEFVLACDETMRNRINEWRAKETYTRACALSKKMQNSYASAVCVCSICLSDRTHVLKCTFRARARAHTYTHTSIPQNLIIPRDDNWNRIQLHKHINCCLIGFLIMCRYSFFSSFSLQLLSGGGQTTTATTANAQSPVPTNPIGPVSIRAHSLHTLPALSAYWRIFAAILVSNKLTKMTY